MKTFKVALYSACSAYLLADAVVGTLTGSGWAPLWLAGSLVSGAYALYTLKH